MEKVFQQAHDTLWSGGKRNPAEAFDELYLKYCLIRFYLQNQHLLHQNQVPIQLMM